MDTLEFMHWCSAATAQIKYRPDRERVCDELYAHLEDRCAAMTEAGVPEAEAVKQALAAMGSAEEVAEQMAKIHRPFWGYLLRFSRWLLLIAAVLVLFTVPRWILRQPITGSQHKYETVYFDSERRVENGLRDERTFCSRPMVRDSSDGYLFTLTRAAEWHETGTTPDGTEVNDYHFHMLVEVFNLRPWAQYSDILREFYAVDSLGNRYEAYMRSRYDRTTPTLTGNWYRSGLCTVTWEMWLSEYRSHGADWIELRYDQSGRDVRLRIDLTGGETA